jgi:hypothetical protein
MLGGVAPGAAAPSNTGVVCPFLVAILSGPVCPVAPLSHKNLTVLISNCKNAAYYPVSSATWLA